MSNQSDVTASAETLGDGPHVHEQPLADHNKCSPTRAQDDGGEGPSPSSGDSQDSQSSDSDPSSSGGSQDSQDSDSFQLVPEQGGQRGSHGAGLPEPPSHFHTHKDKFFFNHHHYHTNNHHHHFHLNIFHVHHGQGQGQGQGQPTGPFDPPAGGLPSQPKRIEDGKVDDRKEPTKPRAEDGEPKAKLRRMNATEFGGA